ncbi:MAG: hypothetical protein ACRER2_04075 [Methylococcales bacterium]
MGAFASHEGYALREVREKLGMKVTDGRQKLFRLSASPEIGMEFCRVYGLENDGPVRIDPEEIQDGH